MNDEHTLDFLDIPVDGSFIALGHTLKSDQSPGVILFDLKVKEGEEPTDLLIEILEAHGSGKISHLEHQQGEPFFSVIQSHSPISIVVIPEAWLPDALELPAFLDTFSKNPFLNRILEVQNFFLSIKKLASVDIILGFYKDKLQQFKGCFFDSFADFFNLDYFSNMVLFAYTQMASEKMLIEKFGQEEVFDRIAKYTPFHLLALPKERLKRSFDSIASLH